MDFVAAAGSGPGTQWTTVPLDTMKQAAFMAEVGTIKAKPASWKDYFFPGGLWAAGKLRDFWSRLRG